MRWEAGKQRVNVLYAPDCPIPKRQSGGPMALVEARLTHGVRHQATPHTTPPGAALVSLPPTESSLRTGVQRARPSSL